MKLITKVEIEACVSLGLLMATATGAQNFGAAKEKVTLHRKLPALVHLPGDTINVKVTGHDDQRDLTRDLEALLETELLKDDPRLREDDTHPSALITCQIINFAHPQPTVTTRPSLAITKKQEKPQTFTRVTGELSVSFQAKSASGQMLTSDNVTAKYDEEFDSSGNATSQGVMGSVTGGFKRLTGGASSEDLNPPTDSELRSRLMAETVQKIAEYIVNTDETVDVFLAKGKGALDDGNKLAATGLWERALETFETATPLPKPDDDAYRLYDVGVAYEAQAYLAEDSKAAMKFLDEAAINYGKAIDQKPSERYFLEPQKRIEDAIAHYKELEEQKQPKPVAVAAASEKPSTPGVPAASSVPATSGAAGSGQASSGPSAGTAAVKALTNAQVIAMVKASMDDATIAQAIQAAKAVNFDLTGSGLQDLTSNGASNQVVTAMKTRAARRPAEAKPAAVRPAAAKPPAASPAAAK